MTAAAAKTGAATGTAGTAGKDCTGRGADDGGKQVHRKEHSMMETVKELYGLYFERIMAWYNGLEQLYQYGVLFLFMVFGFFVFAGLFMSRRISR